MGDMTYDEIKSIKSDIVIFIRGVEEFSKKNSRRLSENDKSFFIFLTKRIIFFKYLCPGFDPSKKYFCEVMISDLYYLITDIIEGNWRYVHVNERSIIENYTRLLIFSTVEENHVTLKLIESLKEKYGETQLLEDEYSLIKNEYVDSCNYVHGGELLRDSLISVFSQMHRKHWDNKKANDYYERFMRMIKIFEKMLLIEYKSYIDGCFHRRKSLLEYLLGENAVDALFI